MCFRFFKNLKPFKKVGCYCPVCLKRVGTFDIKDFDPFEKVVLGWLKRHCRYNCGHSKTLKLGELFLYLFKQQEDIPAYAFEFENVQPSAKKREANSGIKNYAKKYGNKNKQLVSVEEIASLQKSENAK